MNEKMFWVLRGTDCLNDTILLSTQNKKYLSWWIGEFFQFYVKKVLVYIFA